MASYYYWTGQTELFVAESDKSLALNPNDPRALGELGIYVSGALGDLERGAELARRAMRLDPNFPPYYRYALFREAYFTERYEDALTELKRINLTHLFPHQVFLAISHAQLGNRDEARAAVGRVIELQPEFSAVWFMDRFQFHEQLEPAFLDGAEEGWFANRTDQLIRPTTRVILTAVTWITAAKRKSRPLISNEVVAQLRSPVQCSIPVVPSVAHSLSPPPRSSVLTLFAVTPMISGDGSVSKPAANAPF